MFTRNAATALKPMTNATRPSVFLFVVTPVFMGWPSGSYPRPRGEYRMRKRENDRSTTPTREKVRVNAENGRWSVTMTRTITRSPKARTHRLNAASGNGDQHTLRRQYAK